MDKLSLYEILSFLFPGYLVVVILNLYSKWIFKSNEIFEIDKLGNSLLIFCVSLIIGLTIHVITMKIFNKQKWFKKLIFKETSKLDYEPF